MMTQKPFNQACGILFGMASIATAQTSGNSDLAGIAVGNPGDTVDIVVPDISDTLHADWGDAADPSYPTLKVSNGAFHVINPDMYLGGSIDGEGDGQPDPNALGDDNNDGNDDDDGVTIPSLVLGNIATIDIVASLHGRIDAWIDFNQNGTWGDPGDQILTAAAVHPGMNSFTIAVPATAPIGMTFARARYSTSGLLPFDGPAQDGEVEDYIVWVRPETNESFDYGDAPDPSYPTLLVNDGARHLVTPSATGLVLKLGPEIDTESDGQPTVFASGDDAMGPHDDEDGVTFLTPLQAGLNADIEVEASATGMLDAWIDFNKNGSWTDPGEQIYTSAPLGGGVNALNFFVPHGAVTGDTYARFRFSSGGGLSPSGAAQDGEVEDYLIKIKNPNQDLETDWGDAPEKYPVLSSNNGAYHFIMHSLFLGSWIDSEGNGQPSANALKDDIDSFTDDEDGITFTSALNPGASATISAIASLPGHLDAWIDFNQDGDWTDPGEQIFASEPVVSGANNLNFPVTNSASAGNTFARFRLSSGGGLSPEGGASDGEVEDYKIRVEEGSPNGELDWGDAPDKPYPTLAVNNGASHLITTGVYLGSKIDAEGDGQPTVDALGDDDDGIDDDDGVFFSPLEQGNLAEVIINASTKGYINAWIDFDKDGSWGGGEQIILNSPVVAGDNPFTFMVPSSAVTGKRIAARVRFNLNGGLGPTGFAEDGEVEDYTVTVKEDSNPNEDLIDWGDAPDPRFPTLVGSNGASHLIDDLYLGESVDAEPDGQPSPGALGDDLDGNDDDDGIRFLTRIISGSRAHIRVLPTMTGILDAWIDFDGDGTWLQANNRIFHSQTVNLGDVLSFPVPKMLMPRKVIARFRLSHTGADYKGFEIGGEVEDYRVKVGKPIQWILTPNVPRDYLQLSWAVENEVSYVVQSSTTPEQWIAELLSADEVPRADDLFPTGIAWKNLGHGPGISPDSENMLPPYNVQIDRSKDVGLFRVVAMPE
ncbi:MAG: GEVED domain-containing protein [Roseibacillus sp.]|nr:GEVED domain-containing protein [Roseibacillus sp.]